MDTTTNNTNEPQEGTTTTRFLADGWGTRHTMAILGCIGLAISYSMRFNLSIAIVSMVNSSSGIPVWNQTSSNISFSPPEPLCPDPRFVNDFMTRFHEVSNQTVYDDNDGNDGYGWTEKEQGLIMGSFFWGYVVTQYPGGRLAHKYGAKWVISCGLLFTGIMAILTPVATDTLGKYGLIVIRILQGLGEGVTFPAMNVMIAQWAPPAERSRLTNLVFSGIPFGTAATMAIGGSLIHYFGWPSLFYSIGLLSIIWFAVWTILVYSSPSEHPWISAQELSYIELAIGGQTIKENVPTPWRDLLGSVPVITIFTVHVCQSWGHYFMHTEIPKYLHAVHNFEIQHTGWFSALPQFLNGITCIVTSNISDFLIVRKTTSVLFTRKLCNTIALWGSAASFLGVILGGCNTVVAVTFLNIGGAVLGAGFGGWIVNKIDIAPNHVGTITGINNTASNCFGFIAPFVTGLILQSDPSLQGWRIAFLIPAVLNFTVNIVFLVFSSAEERSWNRPRRTEIPPIKNMNVVD